MLPLPLWLCWLLQTQAALQSVCFLYVSACRLPCSPCLHRSCAACSSLQPAVLLTGLSPCVLQNISLPALTQIGGDLTVTYLTRTQSLYLPSLRRINATYLNLGNATTPFVVAGNGLSLAYNAALQNFSLPVLEALGNALCTGAADPSAVCAGINIYK